MAIQNHVYKKHENKKQIFEIKKKTVFLNTLNIKIIKLS